MISEKMINTDSLFVVCVESGTVLSLRSTYIVDLSDAPSEVFESDSLIIDYVEDNGRPLVQEIGP
jgi:hypothetical protein